MGRRHGGSVEPARLALALAAAALGCGTPPSSRAGSEDTPGPVAQTAPTTPPAATTQPTTTQPTATTQPTVIPPGDPGAVTDMPKLLSQRPSPRPARFAKARDCGGPVAGQRCAKAGELCVRGGWSCECRQITQVWCGGAAPPPMPDLGAGWSCAPDDPDAVGLDGCPWARPKPGAPCAAAGKVCNYDGGGCDWQNLDDRVTCTQGAWVYAAKQPVLSAPP